MSGHNKWSSIKHKKGAADAKRGKLFSRLAKEITLAAQEGGGVIDMNTQLRSAVTAARSANMPSDNIERAIKKGTGELAGANLEVLVYEGYGPGSVAILVTCLSDNRNRTAAEVRAVFTRHSCSLAGVGAVAWMFHRKARFVVSGTAANEDTLLELLLNNGVDIDDLEVDDGIAEITAPLEAFAAIAEVLETAGIPVDESGLTMVPENTMQLTETSVARQVLRFIEALEDCEDTQAVHANFDMSDELMAELGND